MVVFAWIIWCWILGIWMMRFIMFIAAFLGFANGKSVSIEVDIFSLITSIITFVFLSIYLFG